MSFGAPLFLYALAALPVLIALVGWALARRAASVRRIGDPALIERLSVAASRRMRILRFVLWFSGLTLIIFALARPQWGSDIEIVEQRGRAGDGGFGCFAQYARPRHEAHPPRSRQAGNIRHDFTAGRRRGWHCPVLRRQLHPVPVDVRLRHRQDLPESRKPGCDLPAGHRDRRGYRDGDDRLQQSAGGSEDHRHYDGR